MAKSIKIPIDEFGEGNCCPECGSVKINAYHQFPVTACIDLKTGKERFYQYINGKWALKRKPSNRDKAWKYESAKYNESQVTIYECRRCGWRSEPFTPQNVKKS